MAKFSIYSRDGQKERYVGTPRFSSSYLGIDCIEFGTITSPSPIEWEVGDYIDYSRTGMRYTLYSLPQPKKVARRNEYGAAFEYSNVQFFAATKQLEIAPFRDIVPEDNKLHFSTRPEVSTYEDIYGISRRIQACMDDMYPGKWRIEVYDTDDADLVALFSETKDYSVSGGSCLDALSQIYDTWKNVGWIHTYDSLEGVDVITIGRANVRDENNTTDAFAYGMGNGLTSIRKAAANEGEFATRLYVYGSERNIPNRHYNQFDIREKDSVDIRNLMLPLERWGKTDGKPDASKAYLQADEATVAKFGLIPRTVYFDGSENDEIYPSIEGLTCTQVRDAMIAAGEENVYLPPISDDRIDKVVSSYGWGAGTKEDYEASPYFTMHINPVGFDIAEQGRLTAEGFATLSMKSGGCAGRDFKVLEFSLDKFKRPVLKVEKVWDDSLGQAFPNDWYPIDEGDYFVILDIPMPEYYISLAEDRLYAAAEKMLSDYTRVSAFYEPNIDAIKAFNSGLKISAGMYMKVQDADIIDTEDKTDYVLIDSLSIDEKGDIPSYRVTLQDLKRSSRSFGSLEEMIDETKDKTRKELDKQRKYTQRTFAQVRETLTMLEGAIEGFDAGINPITLQTMGILVGSQTLQFAFINSLEDTTKTIPAYEFDEVTGIFSVPKSVLMHYTIGVNEVTTSANTDHLRKWEMNEFASDPLLDGKKAYYLYASVPEEGVGDFVLSEIPLDFKVNGGYNLLVGVLNTEYEGTRSFVPLHGYTEVLPGQITTDVIRSADGNTFFDLVNGVISGKIHFEAGSTGVENLGINVGGQNLLRNSAFTGDYLSEELTDETVLEAASQMYSAPLDHWDGTANVSVVEEAESASGYAARMPYNGILVQPLYQKTIAEENYVLSFRAKGEATVTAIIGGVTSTIEIDSADAYKRYVVSFVAAEGTHQFVLRTNAEILLCEPQLERGTVATAWGYSWLDNNSDRAYWQSMKYLQSAMAGSTTVAGGLVLTNLIQLGSQSNNSEFVEKAGVSGLYTDDDSLAFWAGGTMAQAIELVKAYSENAGAELSDAQAAALAKFAVTHGGRAILNDMIVRGYIYALGGKIGDLIIRDNGIGVDTDAEGAIVFSRSGLIARQKDGSYVELGTCGSNAIAINGKDAGGLCYFDEDQYKIAAQINAADGYHAIHSLSGVYAGLRPNIREIKNDDILDALDHTIILSNTGTITLTLPSSPKKGQTYKIIHTNTNGVLFSHPEDDTIIDVSTAAGIVTSFSEQTTLTLTYLDHYWYAEFNN